MAMKDGREAFSVPHTAPVSEGTGSWMDLGQEVAEAEVRSLWEVGSDRRHAAPCNTVPGAHADRGALSHVGCHDVSPFTLTVWMGEKKCA